MSGNTKNSILNTEHLAIGYRSKTRTDYIAKAISITLKKGELIGVIGRNGMGKSTLLRTLSGMQQPLEGIVRLNGKPLSGYTPKTLSKIMSVVLTDRWIASNLSVLELVSLGRHPYTNWIGRITHLDKKHIQNALQVTEIAHLKHKKCFELSDGELQKTMIARAIAQDTPVIILDEPTSHLDIYHKTLVFKLLSTLTQQYHKTILFSSHDIHATLQLCDKLVVFTEREIYFESPQQLIERGVLETLFSGGSINSK